MNSQMPERRQKFPLDAKSVMERRLTGLGVMQCKLILEESDVSRRGSVNAGVTCPMNSRRLFLITSLTALVSCRKSRSESDRRSEWLRFAERARMKRSADVELAVRNAQRSDRAVIFVHVDWSMDMYFVGPTFIEFCEAYNSLRGLPAVGFHYIDFSPATEGYLPLRNLDGWKELESQRGGGSLIHGQGEVAWLKRGRAVAVQRIEYDMTPEDLLIQTLSAFKDCT